MSTSEERLRAHAVSLLADALGEDYVAEPCYECGNATLAPVDNVLKCDTCGNMQAAPAKRLN